MFHRPSLPQDLGSLLFVLRTYWQSAAKSPFMLPREKERAQNIANFIISCTSDELFLKKLANPKFLGLIELYTLRKSTYALTEEQKATYQSMIQIIDTRINAISEPISIFEQVLSLIRTLSAQDANIDEAVFYVDFLIKLQTCADDKEFAAMINNNLLSSWELELLQRLEFIAERAIDKQESAQFRQLIGSKASPLPLLNNSIGSQLASNSSVLSQLKHHIAVQLQKEVPDYQFEMIFELAAVFSELQDDAALINFLKGKATDDERFVLGSIPIEGNSSEFYEFKNLVFPTVPHMLEFTEATPEDLLSIEDSFTSMAVRKAEGLIEEMKINALPSVEIAPSETRKKVSLIYLFRQYLKIELSVKIKLESIVEDNQFFDLLSKNTFNLSLIELMELDACIQKYKTFLSEELVTDFSKNLASAMDFAITLNAASSSISGSIPVFEDHDDDYFWSEDDIELLDNDVEEDGEESLSSSSSMK